VRSRPGILPRSYWCGDEDPLDEDDDCDEDPTGGWSAPIMPSEFEADFD
jgi:hypothetical protein